MFLVKYLSSSICCLKENIFGKFCVTRWEKCAVRPGLKPGTHRRPRYPAAWHIISPMVTKSQPWYTPSQIWNSSSNFGGIHCKASSQTNQACMHGPTLGAKCHRVRKMCSQTGARTWDPSTDWAIWLPNTLSPLKWLNLNRDIHPHKFEIRPQIWEVNFHCKPSKHAWHIISPMVTKSKPWHLHGKEFFEQLWKIFMSAKFQQHWPRKDVV